MDLLDIKQKKRYYSFEIYSILKKTDLTMDDLIELKKYYVLEIDYKLLDEYKINRMFVELEKLYINKDINKIKKMDLEEYSKIVNDVNNLGSNKKEKINDYYKKYYLHKLNNLLSSSDYKNNSREIFEYVNKLEELGYVLNSKQKKRLDVFKLNFKLNKINDFDEDVWFPLFSKGELGCIKSSIESNPDDLCKIIKKLFPYYKISYDYFCEKINPKTNKKLYDNQEDISRTMNIQCIIMLMVGIINYKLSHTRQEFQIIIKGGKTLQLLLSKIYGKKNADIDYKSSDIDLIINPINGIVYDKTKCKTFTMNFVNLIKWIFNISNNPYSFDNYISSEPGREYPEIIKISHKIQKDNATHYNSGYTAIADIDFGEKNHLMYENLIYDWEYSNKYGKLLYVYQNLNDYLLEKIYYLDYYIKELDKLIVKSELPNVKLTNDEYKNFNNYQRFIDKFSKQIIQIIKIEFDKNNLDNNLQMYLDNFTKKNNIEINIEKILKYLY